jgi:hypothetical protein
MPSDAQSARDDLAFVRNLFDAGDQIPGWGEVYLAAGLCYGTQMLLYAAQAKGWLPPAPPVMLAVGVAPTIVFLALLGWIRSRQRAARPPAAVARAVAATFGAIGLANLALAAVIGSVAWREQSLSTWLIFPCAVFVLQGAAWVVVFAMKRRGWHLAVAVGWLIAAIVMALSIGDLAAYALVGAAGIWACMAAPGVALMRGADAATRR